LPQLTKTTSIGYPDPKELKGGGTRREDEKEKKRKEAVLRPRDNSVGRPSQESLRKSLGLCKTSRRRLSEKGYQAGYAALCFSTEK